MGNYRNRLAEAAIRDFPAIKRDYESYKLMLEARALAGAGCVFDEHVDGGGAASNAGDRYMDRFNDPVLLKLQLLFEGIYFAFNGLTSTERRVVALRFWQKMEVFEVARELGFSERSLYRQVGKILTTLYRPILDLQPLLEDWRAGALK